MVCQQRRHPQRNFCTASEIKEPGTAGLFFADRILVLVNVRCCFVSGEGLLGEDLADLGDELIMSYGLGDIATYPRSLGLGNTLPIQISR